MVCAVTWLPGCGDSWDPALGGPMTKQEGLESAGLVLPTAAKILDFQGDAGRDVGWNFLISMPCRFVGNFAQQSQFPDLRPAHRIPRHIQFIVYDHGWTIPNHRVLVAHDYESDRGTRDVAVSRTGEHSAECLAVVTGGTS